MKIEYGLEDCIAKNPKIELVLSNEKLSLVYIGKRFGTFASFRMLVELSENKTKFVSVIRTVCTSSG